MQLVRATLDLVVETPWGRYVLRPPTVREALAIISAVDGGLEAGGPIGEGNQAAFWNTLRGWLPLRLLGAMQSAHTPTEKAAETALQMVSSGAPQPEDVAGSEEDAEEEVSSVTWADIAWEDRLADYMHIYGCTLSEALAEPWAGFLLLLRRTQRARAQHMLDYLHAKSLPHVKEKQRREQALKALREQAGVGDSREAPRTVPTGQEQLDKLERIFGQFRPKARA